jgi:hypothetical protein
MVQGRGRVLAVMAAAAGCALVVAPAAGAATITVCAKAKTGELRLRSGAAAKKKCPKGWKRVRWTTTGTAGRGGVPGLPGATGPQGPVGPAYTVRYANGAVVGQFLGVFLQGFPFYMVLRDGGVFTFLGSGEAFTLGTSSPSWKTNDCSGTTYARPISGLGSGSGPRLFGGSFRFVFRTLSGGTFGPTSAWKSRGTTETIPATQLYRRNSTTGVCEVDGAPYAGELVPLDPVPAPPDFVGPLTVG